MYKYNGIYNQPSDRRVESSLRVEKVYKMGREQLLRDPVLVVKRFTIRRFACWKNLWNLLNNNVSIF